MSTQIIFAIFGAIGAVGIPLAVAFMRIGALIEKTRVHEEELSKLRPVVHDTASLVAGLQGHALAADRIEEYVPQLMNEIREMRQMLAARG